jgi:hypothetical protein
MGLNMNREDIIRMAREAGFVYAGEDFQYLNIIIERFATLVASAEREACEALHDHEDVLAPVGNSSWGEAYQEGWGQGTSAYRDAIKARGQA